MSADRVVVGREVELEKLDRALEASTSGHGRAVMVVGDAGIGKSTLLRACGARAAARGVLVAWGHGWLDGASTPLLPWTQVLRTVAGHVAGDRPLDVGPGAAPLLTLVPELRGVVAGSAPPPETADADFFLRDAIVTVLRRVASRQPLAVFIDDLHVADTASLRMALHLAPTLTGVPLWLAVAARPTTAGDAAHQELSSLRSTAAVLELQGLTAAACSELAAERFDRSLDRGAATRIWEQTGGNPVFVEDLLTHAPPDEPAAPTVVARRTELAITDRLDRASGTVRLAIEAGSVLGRIDDAELIAAVADDVPPNADEWVRTSLAEAWRIGVVERSAGGELTFRPPLLATAVYESIEPARRGALHLRCAEALVARWGPVADDHAAEIARHLVAALPSGDPVVAGRWAMRAAEQASSGAAHDDAARWYGEALRLASTDESGTAERRSLLLARGRELALGGGAVEAVEVLTEVERQARSIDPVQQAEASVWLAEARRRALGHAADERTMAILTETLAGAEGEHPGLAAMAAEHLARLETWLGESTRALAMARNASDAAERAGDRRSADAARRAWCWATAGPLPLEDKLEASRVHLAARVDEPEEAWTVHAWLLRDALERGDRAWLTSELAACRQLAHEVREPFLVVAAQTIEITVALLEGRFDDAERTLRHAIEACQRWGVDPTNLLAQQSTLARERGRVGIDEAFGASLADVLPSPRSALYWAVLATGWAEAGRLDEARIALDRLGVDGFARLPRNADWLPALVLCAEATVLLDARDLASTIRLQLLPFRDRAVVAGPGPNFFVGAVAHHTGALATVLGDVASALGDLEDAEACHRRLGAGPCLARTLFEQGRALTRRGGPGDAGRAATVRNEARDLAVSLGMVGLTGRLDDVDETTSRRATFVADGSTWEVAFTGEPFRLPDSKGLHCLHRLLRHQGEEISAMELAGTAKEPERARVNVTRQITAAIDRIQAYDPALATHLRGAVQTGRICRYRPATPQDWRLV